MTDLARKSPR